MIQLRQYFALLEIPPDASYEEAKAAYRDLVNVWHPDKYAHNVRLHGKATEKLKQLNTAWKHLDVYYRGQLYSEKSPDDLPPVQDQPPLSPGLRCSCPHCETTNDIPEGIPLGLARCGACGNELDNAEWFPQQQTEAPKRIASLSPAELVAGISVGLIIMLILFILHNTI